MEDCSRCECQIPATKLRVPPEAPWVTAPVCEQCSEDLQENYRIRWLNDHYDLDLREPYSLMSQRGGHPQSAL
jgi:hypothetical protein